MIYAVGFHGKSSDDDSDVGKKQQRRFSIPFIDRAFAAGRAAELVAIGEAIA